MDKIVFGENCVYSTDCSKTGLNNNGIVFGPSGSGKTMSITEPCLLETFTRSVVPTVTKRRIVNKYKPLMKERGYEVQDLDFVHPEKGDIGYDPLGQVKSYQDITFLAESIVKANPRKDKSNADPYWDEAATSLLSAEIAYTLMTKDNATFADVLDMHDHGKSVWDKSTVKGVLINEKYIGDVIFQKTYREDCISKKSKINRGEVDRYLIMDNHPAIIDRETFNLVRKELVRRSSKRRSSDRAITELGKYSGKYALSELLTCDVCGGPFRRKTWSRKGIKKIYWRCLRHTEKGDNGCPQSRGIEETVLHNAICRGLTNCIPETGEVKNMVALMLACATSKDKMLMEWQEVQKEIKELMRKADAAETMCIKTQGNKEPYMEQIKKYYASIARLREREAELKKKLERNEEFQTELKQIGEWIEADEISIAEYNDDIVRYLIDSICITEDFKLVINMKGGDTVVEEIYPIE